jgi:hypothetical protein
MTKSPGQLAYEADCLAKPLYHDGGKRKAWDQLGKAEQDSWERNPTPFYAPQSTCIEHGPGGTIRLSHQIYVF